VVSSGLPSVRAFSVFSLWATSCPDAEGSCVAASCCFVLLFPFPLPLFPLGTNSFPQSMPRVISGPSWRVILSEFQSPLFCSFSLDF
jgi:hypothetical protein